MIKQIRFKENSVYFFIYNAHPPFFRFPKRFFFFYEYISGGGGAERKLGIIAMKERTVICDTPAGCIINPITLNIFDSGLTRPTPSHLNSRTVFSFPSPLLFYALLFSAVLSPLLNRASYPLPRHAPQSVVMIHPLTGCNKIIGFFIPSVPPPPPPPPKTASLPAPQLSTALPFLLHKHTCTLGCNFFFYLKFSFNRRLRFPLQKEKITHCSEPRCCRISLPQKFFWPEL